MGAPVASAPVLQMERITKRFGQTAALHGVDFALERGEVHALVGENGAGKSTLIKIVTGAYRRDEGSMHLDGVAVDFATPAEAQRAGAYAVHQEIHLLPHRTVAENVFLAREPQRWGLIDWRRMYDECATLLERLGLDNDERATVNALSTARQQMVAIARGISMGAKVLVLDEPSSSLATREVGVLHDLVRRLKGQGTAMVYISHRFDELYAVCDRVTVLRDGKLAATRPLASLERLDLVCLMLGKSREALQHGTTSFREHHAPVSGVGDAPLLFRARSLARAPILRDVSLDVASGEIVGLGGLLGSGRTETARAIFGATPVDSGEMHVDGAVFRPRTPRDAIRAGIAFVSEDRRREGIIPELSIRENLTLAVLPTLTRCGVVSRARQRAIVDRFMLRLGIKATSADQRIRDLSGGNQQKVLLARWLCAAPKLLILDEPTRGIDIGAKGEIQRIINELAASGLGVLMISSELEELAEGSTRIVVLRDGAVAAELVGDAISQHAIVQAMADVSGA